MKWIIQNIHFNYNVNVSVFETNIRILGSLLSNHLLLEEKNFKNILFTEYKGELLSLALDLANRLLYAFNTPTGIPYGTVYFFLK